MLPLSVGIAFFSGLTGVYISFFIDSAPAPTIILVLTVIFIITFIICTRRSYRVSKAKILET